MNQRDFLTREEMAELDDLLDRVDSLTPAEDKRLHELHEKNAASLMPELGIVLSALCDLEEESL